MVRPEFYNGAHNEICSWVNFLSLYWLEALSFFVLWADSFHYGRISIDALLHCRLFYEMSHRPYILELYHWNDFSLFLSPFHLSTSFFSISLHNLESDWFFFCVYAKKFQLLQWYDRYIISWLVLWILWIQIMRSDELVISSISY